MIKNTETEQAMNRKNLFAIILAIFYLGTYNGYLALWQKGQHEPVRIYPYSAEVYTKIDQTALKNGIVIEDIATLEKYLDDYIS